MNRWDVWEGGSDKTRLEGTGEEGPDTGSVGFGVRSDSGKVENWVVEGRSVPSDPTSAGTDRSGTVPAEVCVSVPGRRDTFTATIEFCRQVPRVVTGSSAGP